MRKIFFFTISFIAFISLLLQFGYPLLVQKLNLEGRAGLKIDSNPSAKVFVSNQEVGQTPFEDEQYKPGEYLVTLQAVSASSSANPAWQGYVKLNAGTLTVINRDLSDDKSISSGLVINLTKGSGTTIISTPTESVVSIDNQPAGRTPLYIPNLASGEHLFTLSHDNFLSRSAKVNVIDGYNLQLNVDLKLSDADLTKISTPPTTSNLQIIVKKTPTGFLNVRDTPSINGKIITQVKPGDALVLLEEIPNWDRIRTEDNKEGYVASPYVEKVSQ